MWWGHSPGLDMQLEVNKHQTNYSDDHLEVLIVGGTDARHILKTIASSYLYSNRLITYDVIESSLEQVARSILLLNVCLEEGLGLQEATRYYLEILGNTLVRPASAKYLIKTSHLLINLSANTIDCPWFSLEKFKHDKDRLGAIFKFWERAARENVSMLGYWDRRVRQSLRTRYDYRDGVFDWDYHMILKPRGISNLTLQEYKFWRNNGIAFTWLEGEPARDNPTLLSNIVPHGPGFVHHGYLGDIRNGPFSAWAFHQTKTEHKYRATDIAEREVTRCIYEIRTRQPMQDELVGSHRDSSILNGTLVIDPPNKQMEQEIWKSERNVYKKSNLSWVDIPNHKVIFHPVASLRSLKHKTEYLARYDCIWLAHGTVSEMPDLVPLLKKGGTMLVELKKYIVESREENLQTFVDEIRVAAQENGLHEIQDTNAREDCIARFYK